MSEPIPESIPTSTISNPSSRPHKRPRPNPSAPARKNLPPSAASTALQASQLAHLFANPDRAASISSARSSNSTNGGLPAPPELVPNVQGSSAGAGSGEFHVYKASRRREYERVKMMEEEALQEKEQEVWEAERNKIKLEDERRAEKRRKMRERKKKGGAGDSASKSANGDVVGQSAQHREVKDREINGVDNDNDDSAKSGVSSKVSMNERAHPGGTAQSGNGNATTSINEQPDAAEVDVGGGIVIHDDDD